MGSMSCYKMNEKYVFNETDLSSTSSDRTNNSYDVEEYFKLRRKALTRMYSVHNKSDTKKNYTTTYRNN